ncbi:DNA-3-methyladenine glycosylase [Burkholderia multivorans]|uniref:DNA-3-methyladenine glycosylase n=1 Tax=Burkholderia multivorans TaxID=87883 RepID=UPI000D006605|nr:DNA-3-methyladenine glycosylase [Burkholderia multivorans]MDN7747286.1 DNA-3-methyladenine glycosylase [Burkholderia multivorans]MDN8006930.1 DNA-3-methyladenine glycosylase [Burkholderia multivorans]PRH10010.1 DNA-3-methyladenine glycosylase [Burkholderia multivorans]
MTRNRRTPGWPGTLLSRAFFDRAAPTVAPLLLNKILASADGRAGRIVEVEAYAGAIDPAAHTYRGKTPRNATMFGPPGHMYVYFTYGMHWCCNCVCGPDGAGTGVLIRALEPLSGIERMRAARPPQTRDRDLCRGPARLTQAMGITGAQDGADLVRACDGFAIVDDGTAPPAHAKGGPRIGIRVGTDLPWRWSVPGNPYVSGPRAIER